MRGTYVYHGRSVHLLTVGTFRWFMAKTGRYKILTNLFGLFPCVAAILVYLLRENSSEFEQWFSIVSKLEQHPGFC